MRRLLSVCVVLSIAAGMYLCAEKAETDEDLLKRSVIRTEFKTDSLMPAAAQTETMDTVTIDTGDSYGLREEEKRILLAYAKYLQKYYKDYPYETDGIKYDLVFIDIDNIPELAVIPSDAHASGVQICVYDDGKVVETGEFGSFGNCRFNPYENLIFSTYMGQGEAESFFYRLEGNESMELLALHSVPQYENFQYTGTYYEIDGTEVSEEVYKQVCEEWDWEELNVWGYEDAVSVNDIDNLYRELYDRYSFLKEQGRAEQDDSCLEEWKQAYLTYLEEDKIADTYTYSLLYVDDDDIPELMINTHSGAGGYFILTFHDPVLEVWHSDPAPDITYIERGNLICSSGGKMGYYYDSIYTIQNGRWVYVDGGVWGDGPDGVQLDENDNIIEFFYWTGEEPWNREEYWSGEEMTEEEYEARLSAIYPTERSVYPQKYYILDEIQSIFRTGDVTSAGHRYELIVEDVSWKEAEMLCHERGGYLATITSYEEFQRLQERMIEDKKGITFFVGATDKQIEGRPFGYRWLEPGTKYGYDMSLLHYTVSRFWLEGEPSHRGFTESGVEVRGNYVVLFYREKDGWCYLKDVPSDLLEAAPSYAGRVGYICEYE